MSTKVENIVLAKLSLKEALSTYLNSSSVGWDDEYSIFLYGDPDLATREIVFEAKDIRSEVSLPLIIIGSGRVYNSVEEIGSNAGNDRFTIEVVVVAKNSVQLDTLANAIRRKMHNLAFNIYDHSSQRNSELGVGNLTDVQMLDLTDLDQANPVNKYVAIINATLEIPSSSLL